MSDEILRYESLPDLSEDEALDLLEGDLADEDRGVILLSLSVLLEPTDRVAPLLFQGLHHSSRAVRECAALGLAHAHRNSRTIDLDRARMELDRMERDGLISEGRLSDVRDDLGFTEYPNHLWARLVRWYRGYY